MISRVLRTLAVATLVAAAAACSRSDASQASAPSIQLVPASGATPARIEVTGLSSAALDDLRDARLTPDQWPSLLRVAVAEDGPAMVGSYDIGDGSVRFTPAFRFDPGREYHVRFDPSVVAGALIPPVAARVGLPARVTGPTTVVERVYPTADLVPENLLRVYVEFSAPMGRKSGLEYVQLLDDRGTLLNRDHARAWLPGDIPPGGSADVEIDVPAPPQPGRYGLKFDLVSEGIDWFEKCGSPTTTRTLIVR